MHEAIVERLPIIFVRGRYAKRCAARWGLSSDMYVVKAHLYAQRSQRAVGVSRNGRDKLLKVGCPVCT